MSNANRAVKAHIFHSGIKGDQYPWNLDLVNRVSGDYSDSCWTFKTYQEAVESIPKFLAATEDELADLIQKTPS